MLCTACGVDDEEQLPQELQDVDVVKFAEMMPDEISRLLASVLAAQNLGGMASALNLSQCLWACAKMGQSPPSGFVAAAESELPRCAKRLNPENVDCILWALATLGLHLNDDAMSALVSSAARLSDRMDAEMLVKTHWALARLRRGTHIL